VPCFQNFSSKPSLGTKIKVKFFTNFFEVLKSHPFRIKELYTFQRKEGSKEERERERKEGRKKEER
jgi:hypothetical protein